MLKIITYVENRKINESQENIRVKHNKQNP